MRLPFSITVGEWYKAWIKPRRGYFYFNLKEINKHHCKWRVYLEAAQIKFTFKVKIIEPSAKGLEKITNADEIAKILLYFSDAVNVE